jgi:MotA/TolQ/ExbB proton channel family
VARKEKRKGLFTSLGSLGWPIFIGGWATGLYFLLVYRGPLHYDFLLRYTAGHPINMTEVGLFFVGFASLICKFFSISGEMGADAAIELPEPVPGETTEEACNSILGRLSELPAKIQDSYLGKRLRNVAQTVARRGLADGIDEDLRYHADLDVGSQQDSYGLVRIAIWAIPMLGFLGTVVGITMALGDFGTSLGSGKASGDLNTSMTGLLAGLYVAFDTTALALALAMFMMFCQFILERMESQLLASVDDRAALELAGRFERRA